MAYQLGSEDADQPAGLYADPRDRETRPRFRGVLAAAAAFAVIGLFAAGLWFAYQQGLRHANPAGAADVPLIRADERPTRVKPEKPGGMEVPDRDKLIYTQKRPAVEHLLPAPEKPMPRPTAPPAQAEAPPTAPAAPAAPVIAMPAPPQQPSEKVPARPTAAQPAPAKTGGARIQLGSVRSEDLARREWERIKRANSDLLGNLSAAPTRADLGDKGIFYRIQTSAVADADRICHELKQRNVGCILAR